MNWQRKDLLSYNYLFLGLFESGMKNRKFILNVRIFC